MVVTHSERFLRLRGLSFGKRTNRDMRPFNINHFPIWSRNRKVQDNRLSILQLHELTFIRVLKGIDPENCRHAIGICVFYHKWDIYNAAFRSGILCYRCSVEDDRDGNSDYPDYICKKCWEIGKPFREKQQEFYEGIDAMEAEWEKLCKSGRLDSNGATF